MTWRVSDSDLTTLGEIIVAGAGGNVSGFTVAMGELTVDAPVAKILETLTFLRDDPGLKFQQLIDVCGADYPERPLRFDVVYHLLSMVKNRRVRVKVQVDEDTAVPSSVGVFPGAEWFEREAFDMYGLFFVGHPDLRRLLTDYGFHGYPLRKDFPMSGYVEVRYDDDLKRVAYEPIKAVEFRSWDFASPWEGADYARPHFLPGDEKAEKGA
jgi:NADH-quinone oxidoreductase subunit C